MLVKGTLTCVVVLCISFPLTASSTIADCVYLLLSNRLFTEGEHARLLSLPDQFNQDLTQWLQKRFASAGSNLTRAASLRRLTWLHELRRKEYAAASRTLADVTNNNEVRTLADVTNNNEVRTLADVTNDNEVRTCVDVTNNNEVRTCADVTNGNEVSTFVQILLAISVPRPMITWSSEKVLRLMLRLQCCVARCV